MLVEKSQSHHQKLSKREFLEHPKKISCTPVLITQWNALVNTQKLLLHHDLINVNLHFSSCHHEDCCPFQLGLGLENRCICELNREDLHYLSWRWIGLLKRFTLSNKDTNIFLFLIHLNLWWLFFLVNECKLKFLSNVDSKILRCSNNVTNNNYVVS